VVPLSWGDWDPTSWEKLWIYRKRFSAATLPISRVFLDFDGVMTNATVYLNGVELAQHLGGFLPFSVELTELLLPGENDLGVVVDGRPPRRSVDRGLGPIPVGWRPGSSRQEMRAAPDSDPAESSVCS
jgi:beta-galactosidase/beta-glucuronidase